MFIKKLNILTNLNIRAKIGKYFCVLEMCQVFEISRQKSRFSSIIDLEKFAENSQKNSWEKFREKFKHFFFCHFLVQKSNLFGQKMLIWNSVFYLVKSNAFATCDGMMRGCEGGLAINGGCVATLTLCSALT